MWKKVDDYTMEMEFTEKKKVTYRYPDLIGRRKVLVEAVEKINKLIAEAKRLKLKEKIENVG